MTSPDAAAAGESIHMIRLAALLAVCVIVVFLPTVSCGFVNFDDPFYVNNPEVLAGLSPSAVIDALTRPHYTDWAPLTRLSYLADASLHGSAPWGFHFTNVLLHAAAAAGLFLAWGSMTGAPWRCFAAISLFAVHPLRVESVAWASERKDVLSMFFLAVALVTYSRYARRPGAAGMGTVAAAMAASLAAKATLVTLPVLLLVLDAWPLGRWRCAGEWPAGWLRSGIPLVREKIPLFLLATLFSVITILTQAAAIQAEESMPLLSSRIPTALYAPMRYLWMTVWPVGLHARYTHPGGDAVPVAWWLFGAGGCGGIAAVVWHVRSTMPAVACGLVWYMIAMLPVCGLAAHVGMHSHADRYTYVPHVGLFVAAVWAACDLAAMIARRTAPGVPRAVGVAAAGVAAAWIAIDERMIATWRTSETLWANILAHEPGNDFAAEGLVQHHLTRGDVERALDVAEEIAVHHPHTKAFIEIAETLATRGALSGAEETCRREREVKTRCHGSEHPATLEAVVRHLISLRNMGSGKETITAVDRMARDLEPTLRRVLGLGHLATLRVIVLCAGERNRAGDPVAGELHAREALGAAARHRQPLPEIIKPATIALAESLDLQGRPDEADALLAGTITRAGGLDGGLAAVNAPLGIAYAMHLARTGRVGEAIAVLETLARRLETLLGPAHPVARQARGLRDQLVGSATDAAADGGHPR